MRTIRKLKKEEIKNALRLAIKSYPSMGINTEAKLDELEKDVVSGLDIPGREWFGLFEDNVQLGNMVLYDFDINFYGKIIKSKGIGFVATEFLHKKQKIAKEMLQWYLKLSHKQNKSLALLYAFRPDFYKTMGFGFGTKAYNYHTKPERLPHFNTDCDCNYLNQDNKTEVSEFFNELFLSKHGMIPRTDKELDNYLKPDNQTVVGFRNTGKLVALLNFNFKVDRQANDETDIHVRLFYNKSEGLKAALSFLNSQSDQIRDIYIYSQDDDLYYTLPDIRQVDRNILQPPAYHHIYNAGMGIMYRSLNNTELVLNKPCTLDNMKIKFKIEDDFFDKAKQDFIIEWKMGKTQISKSQKYDIELEMSVADYSSWLMNCISLKKLHSYGLLKTNNEALLDLLDVGFYYPQYPICYTRF